MSIKATQEKDLFEKIDFGIRLGAARAKAEHKKAGRSIAVQKNGKVVRVPADKIEIPEEFKDLIEKQSNYFCCSNYIPDYIL